PVPGQPLPKGRASSDFLFAPLGNRSGSTQSPPAFTQAVPTLLQSEKDTPSLQSFIRGVPIHHAEETTRSMKSTTLLLKRNHDLNGSQEFRGNVETRQRANILAKYVFIQDDPCYLPRVLDKYLREYHQYTNG